MTARLTYLALFLAGAALFWFASKRPVEALTAYLVCAAILLLIEWAERRGTLSEPTWPGRREWVDDAEVIGTVEKAWIDEDGIGRATVRMGAPGARTPGRPAETHDEGDSHDHAV
ncbi:MAG TPA: hypothetical protein DC063_03750 [Arenimonas sp.]|nr:hypothetical protein [Candidatus Rokubacteria bacterium]HBD19278.1 hypothetical protein [Arenimonas sp.]